MNPIKWRDHLWVCYGTAEAIEVDEDLAVDAILRLTRHEPLPPHYGRQLRSLDALNRMFGGGPRHLTLTRDRRTFEWEHGRFSPPASAVVVGTLDLDSMTLVGSHAGQTGRADLRPR